MSGRPVSGRRGMNRAPAPSPATAGRVIQPRAVDIPPERVALVDLLDRVLAGGVVISGDITLSIADVDLVTVSLRALVASISALAAPDSAPGSAGSAPGAAGSAPGAADRPPEPGRREP